MKPCSVQVMGGTALFSSVVAFTGPRSLSSSGILFEVTCADFSGCDGQDRIDLLSAPLMGTVSEVYAVFCRQ